MDTSVFLIWYFMGTLLALLIVFPMLGQLHTADLVPDRYKVGAMLFGFVFNAAANALLFKAYDVAPNLAESVVDSKNVLVFVAASLLAYYLPQYFTAIKFHYMQVVGVACVSAGVIILALKWE